MQFLWNKIKITDFLVFCVLCGWCKKLQTNMGSNESNANLLIYSKIHCLWKTDEGAPLTLKANWLLLAYTVQNKWLQKEINLPWGPVPSQFHWWKQPEVEPRFCPIFLLRQCTLAPSLSATHRPVGKSTDWRAAQT